MNERTFWHKLEYRVCRELEGVTDEQGRIVWCDGFIPEEYALGENGRRIGGHAWMGFGGRHQEKWAFTLNVGGPVRSRADIDWAALLPSDGVTGWLSMNPSERFLNVDLSAARQGRRAEKTP